MGRPERPLDPTAGPVARLAHELRELRKAAGSPSYRMMAEAAGFSATTLSQAAAGERLPSLDVVRGYVRACGGRPDAWEPRWKDAEAEVAGEVRDDEADVVPYRGLARFEPDDQELFFGRARLTDDLLQLVCGHRFAAVFGASGSGKSSLLRAGLIPRLQREIAGRGCPAVLRVLTPGERPAATYGHLLTPAADEPESWVRLWDTAAGRWTGDRLPTSAVVDFGASTYTVRGVDESRAGVYSAADGKPLFEAADGVAPSEDGRLVAFCPLGKGGAPRVRDLADGRTVHGPWERAGDICGRERVQLVLDGGGRRLAAVLPSGVRVWDVRSGTRPPDLARTGVRYAAFNADGTFLALADGEEITLWRLGYGSPVFRHPLNNQHLSGLAWDPAHPVLRYLEGATVHTLDVATAVTPAWRNRPVDQALISPDGRTLATARRTGDTYRFQLRATNDGRLLGTPSPPPPGVSHDPSRPVQPEYTLPLLAFTPDGKALAYAVSAPGYEASPQRLTVWDVTRGRVRTTLDLAEKTSAGAVIALALGPDARTLHLTRTTGIGELTNETWDLGRHRRTAVLAGLSSSHLAVRPDGRLLAGDNRTASLPGGRATGRDLVQGDEIGALAFAPDGSRFAAGDQTGRVALWDAAVRQREGILPNVFPELSQGETGRPDGGPDPISDDTSEAVSALAVSPDGRTLAAGGEAGSLQLWDITTQQPLGGLLSTPGDPIDTVAFGPDSGTVYAGSAHVPLQRYVIDPVRAVASVCARQRAHELTRAQWRTYVRDVPYRKVCGD